LFFVSWVFTIAMVSSIGILTYRSFMSKVIILDDSIILRFMRSLANCTELWVT
jgi:hypothetical protein